MKIERHHYELAYQLGRRIQSGQLRLTEARDELARAGVNPNSATILLNNFRHMLEGNRYKRALSSPNTDDFLTWIRRDYGDAALANAVSAVTQHLDYYEGNRGHNLRTTRDILAKHASLLPKSQDSFLSPEEVAPGATHLEGSVRQVLVNVYERNPAARAKCIDHYGTSCRVCEFDFGKTYGELGQDFIHVHHLKELSSIGEEYEVDAIRDLLPVCPNCHAMLHKGTQPPSVDELKIIIADQSS